MLQEILIMTTILPDHIAGSPLTLTAACVRLVKLTSEAGVVGADGISSPVMQPAEVAAVHGPLVMIQGF